MTKHVVIDKYIYLVMVFRQELQSQLYKLIKEFPIAVLEGALHNLLQLYTLYNQYQGSTNCVHSDKHACNVHVKRLLCARNYVHVD